MTDYPERYPVIENQQSPEVPYAPAEDCEVVMTWENTRMYSFGEGEGEYDHILHQLADESFVAFKPSHELYEQLAWLGFPRVYEPFASDTAKRFVAERAINQFKA